MTELISLLAEESEADNGLSSFGGILSGWQGIVGIVLFLVGIAMVYFGIKVNKGYKIDFMTHEVVPEEDTYVEGTAKIQNKVKTTMPNFNGEGEQTFVDWTMVYEVDGEKYKQTIPDDKYEKGMVIDIKYNPDNPQEYYIFDKAAEEAQKAAEENPEEQPQEQPEQEKSSVGTVIIVVSFLIIAMGIALILDAFLS